MCLENPPAIATVGVHTHGIEVARDRLSELSAVSATVYLQAIRTNPYRDGASKLDSIVELLMDTQAHRFDVIGERWVRSPSGSEPWGTVVPWPWSQSRLQNAGSAHGGSGHAQDMSRLGAGRLRGEQHSVLCRGGADEVVASGFRRGGQSSVLVRYPAASRIAWITVS